MKIKSDGLEFSLPRLPPIWIHYSLPLVIVLITSVLWWNRPHLNGIVLAIIVAIGFTISIFMHEVGHAVMAWCVGGRPVRIRMHGLGGQVSLEGVKTRSQDRRITIAGPAVNLIIGLACLALYFTFVPEQFRLGARWREQSPAYDLIALRSLQWLGWFNVAVALLNVLPAYPLDGGHLAHGFIADRWGASRARFWVGLSGFVVGVAAIGVLIGSLMAGMLFWFPLSPIRNWRAMRSGKAW